MQYRTIPSHWWISSFKLCPHFLLETDLSSYFSCMLWNNTFVKNSTVFKLQLKHEKEKKLSSKIIWYIAFFMVLTIIEGETLKTMMSPLSCFTVRVDKCLVIDECYDQNVEFSFYMFFQNWSDFSKCSWENLIQESQFPLFNKIPSLKPLLWMALLIVLWVNDVSVAL